MALDGTYAGLIASITDWLARSGDTALAAAAPDFVTIAEEGFNERIRTRFMIVNNAAFSIAAEFTNLPSDFLELMSIELTGTPPTQLTFKSPTTWVTTTAQQQFAPGKPNFFTIIGNQIRVASPPDATYLARLIYYQKIAAASIAGNWMLTNYPSVYLWGSLLQAAPYMAEDPRIPVWEANLEKALTRLNAADDDAVFSGGPISMVAA